MVMLERIAKAIAASDYDGDDLWEDLSQVIRDSYLNNSRAVLDAMLEPTDGMVSVGYMEGTDWDGEFLLSKAYGAMIQAAKAGV